MRGPGTAEARTLELRACARTGAEAGAVLRHRDARQRTLPHVVKFSGGRSSGMLLLTLLRGGVLDPARGDVVVFNNTSAEHPETYRFVDRCAEETARHRVPFFRIEFQTYEDVRRGEWTRLPSYRLTNGVPIARGNPDGFAWRGEAYEELLSWAAYVPNQFRRTCTKHLKLEPTRGFLDEWLSGRSGTRRLGHHHGRPLLDPDTRYRVHLEHGGKLPQAIFARKHAYCWRRPHVRRSQRYRDLCPEARGRRRRSAEYVTLIGLRADENRRVERVEQRNAHATAHEGEHVYMPLDALGVTRGDVNAFWEREGWDLQLPADAGLSNCVYCFLKGGEQLQGVHHWMLTGQDDAVEGFGKLAGTPCDLEWWKRMERIYGRDLVAEGCQTRAHVERIGFFGARRFSYAALESGGIGGAGRLPPRAECNE